MMNLIPRLIDEKGTVCSEIVGGHHPMLEPRASEEFVLAVNEPHDQNPLYLKYSWVESSADQEAQKHRSRIKVPERYLVFNQNGSRASYVDLTPSRAVQHPAA
jgi:hypothetical protein